MSIIYCCCNPLTFISLACGPSIQLHNALLPLLPLLSPPPLLRCAQLKGWRSEVSDCMKEGFICVERLLPLTLSQYTHGKHCCQCRC